MTDAGKIGRKNSRGGGGRYMANLETRGPLQNDRMLIWLGSSELTNRGAKPPASIKTFGGSIFNRGWQGRFRCWFWDRNGAGETDFVSGLLYIHSCFPKAHGPIVVVPFF